MTAMDRHQVYFHLLARAHAAGLPLVPWKEPAGCFRLHGEDGDLIAAWRPWRQWRAFLRQALIPTPWRLRGWLDRGHLLVCFLQREGPDDWLQLDLHRALTARGLPFAATAPLLALAREEQGVLRLPPGLGAALTALEKRLVHGHPLSPEGDAATAWLQRLAPSGQGRWRLALPLPGLTLRVLASKIIATLANWRHPPGVLLTLSGPDGCGKSTLADELARHLPRRLTLAVHRFHTRPFLLANPWRPPGSGGRTVPPRAGIARSLARLLLAGLDYHAGYWLRVRPLLARGAWVIFDRGIPDYLADPEPRGIFLPDGVLRTWARLLPGYGHKVYLTLSPAQLTARKGELDEAEGERLQRRYHHLATGVMPGLVLDTAEHTPRELAQRLMKGLDTDAEQEWSNGA